MMVTAKLSRKQITKRLNFLHFFLREYFFPSGCAVCGTGLVSMNECWYGLCENCRESLDASLADSGLGREGERCTLCGRPLVSEIGCCLSCRENEPPPFDRLLALFPFSGSFRKLLHAYKFGKNFAVGNYFAKKIEQALSQLPLSAPAGNYAIVPVPPRPGKLKKSGWDQIEYLTGLLKFPVCRCLKRLASGIQKKLNREERKKNLHGRILVKKKPPAVAIIIDDVITTGSTMSACAAALKSGGAETVYGICLFYD